MKHIPPDLPRGGRARIAFVGEAPGDIEVARGRPFVGPAGRMFNGLLRRAGLSRWDCLVTNVFDFKLPGNDVKALGMKKLDAKKALKVFEEEFGEHPYRDRCLTPVASGAYLDPCAVALQLNRLKKELEAARPTLVVPLGGTAMWALLGVPGHGMVEKLRGSVMQETLTGRKAIPTYHPAAILRAYSLRVPFMLDLAKIIREEEKGPAIELPTRRLLIPERPAEIAQWWAGVFKRDEAPIISCDIETFAGEIDCIGFAVDRLEALCVPFATVPAREHYWATAAEEAEALAHVADILTGPWPKLFQNGTYDVQWIWERWGIGVRNYLHDTRLMHHALYPELPKDLATLGASYENERGWKVMNQRKEIKRDA